MIFSCFSKNYLTVITPRNVSFISLLSLQRSASYLNEKITFLINNKVQRLFESRTVRGEQPLNSKV